MNATPRIENVNDGQMYLVIENNNDGTGEFYKNVYRTYADAKAYYNTL